MPLAERERSAIDHADVQLWPATARSDGGSRRLPGPNSASDAERRRLLVTLEMVTASFETLLEVLVEDVRSARRTSALLDEACGAIRADRDS
jgi:hypothetical protein